MPNLQHDLDLLDPAHPTNDVTTSKSGSELSFLDSSGSNQASHSSNAVLGVQHIVVESLEGLKSQKLYENSWQQAVMLNRDW